MKNILITGANGYLGANISMHLSKKGYSLHALCNSRQLDSPEWEDCLEEIIWGDITNDDILKYLYTKEYDSIIHLVSLDHRQSENDIALSYTINVKPTLDLLHHFSSRNLRKFIYISTAQVYGRVSKLKITEETKPAPINIYGLTHLLSENILNYYNQNKNVECINLRLSNSFGSPIFNSNNCWWLIINDLCKQSYYEKKIQLLSDGSPQRDFIHISDVTEAVEFAVENDLRDIGNTFNLASSKTYTILEIANTVKNMYKHRYGVEIPIYLKEKIILENNYELSKIEKFVIDNSKLLKAGFKVKTSVESGIRDLFEYFENLK